MAFPRLNNISFCVTWTNMIVWKKKTNLFFNFFFYKKKKNNKIKKDGYFWISSKITSYMYCLFSSQQRPRKIPTIL